MKDSVNTSVIKNLKYQTTHSSQQLLFKEIDSLKWNFEKIGFFNSQLDTVAVKDSIYTAYFTLGKSSKSIRIYYDKSLLTKKVLFQITPKVTEDYFEISINQLTATLNYLVNYFENKGNSFTEIKLDEIVFKDSLVIAKLKIEISKVRAINSLIIKGVENFPKAFVKHYFNINPTTIFSSEKLTSFSNQIKALSFIDESKPPEVLFTNDSTYVYLYVKKKKANKFDGLIGFTSDETNNKILFNGYLDLELHNIFNGGEQISLNWANNGGNKQLFNFNTTIPYIFNTSITPKLGLDIYKQDSTFINTKATIELSRNINYRHTISLAFISEASTNLLDNQITDVTSYKSSFYGATYTYNILNASLIFPTKFNFNAAFYLGNRKSNSINTNQSRLNLSANYLWSLNFRNHIFIQNINSVLISDNLLTNELYRIGGVNSIRGFNEESIFASLYNIVNLEYRYSTNNTSYLYSISDIGYINNQLINQSQQIVSLGVGYAFTTNVGLLNISYALGKLNKQPFELSNSRFHIKITSFF